MSKKIALPTASWPDTEDLVKTLLTERRGSHQGWRPITAAMQITQRTEQPWMTAEQFDAWYKTSRAKERAAYSALRASDKNTPRSPLPHQILEVNKIYPVRWRHGDLPIPKPVALACAHYALNYEISYENEPEAISAWFAEHGLQATPAARWLGINSNLIEAALRGFRVRAGQRIPYKPRAYMLRALDWMVRVGPFVPYASHASQASMSSSAD